MDTTDKKKIVRSSITQAGVPVLFDEIISGGRQIDVDDHLSLESENPVQNKVVTAALNEKADKNEHITVDGDVMTLNEGLKVNSSTKAVAEGENTTASGYTSHAEGVNTTASADASHAEGVNTTASGISSHAEGMGTIASRDAQHAGGKYNVRDTNNLYAFIIGNGTGDEARHNAFAIGRNGSLYLFQQDGTPVELTPAKLAALVA